jgi:hypothetical protein
VFAWFWSFGWNVFFNNSEEVKCVGSKGSKAQVFGFLEGNTLGCDCIVRTHLRTSGGVRAQALHDL